MEVFSFEGREFPAFFLRGNPPPAPGQQLFSFPSVSTPPPTFWAGFLADSTALANGGFLSQVSAFHSQARGHGIRAELTPAPEQTEEGRGGQRRRFSLLWLQKKPGCSLGGNPGGTGILFLRLEKGGERFRGFQGAPSRTVPSWGLARSCRSQWELGAFPRARGQRPGSCGAHPAGGCSPTAAPPPGPAQPTRAPAVGAGWDGGPGGPRAPLSLAHGGSSDSASRRAQVSQSCCRE